MHFPNYGAKLMHYYSFHIKDFASSTRHLTLMEEALYRNLLDLYHQTEEPITGDFETIARRVRAKTKSEKAALHRVLEEFFVKKGNAWTNHRCDATIEHYKKDRLGKVKAGKQSAIARKSKGVLSQSPQVNHTEAEQRLSITATDEQQTLNTCSTNQEPITSNQKPTTNINNLHTAPPVSITNGKAKAAQVNKSLIDKNMTITPEQAGRATEHWEKHQRQHLDPYDEWDKFKANHIAKGNMMADWDSAWTTWYSNAVTFGKPSMKSSGPLCSTQSPRSFRDNHSDRSWADGL